MIDSLELGRNIAIIREIALRADGASLQSIPARKFSSLILSIGIAKTTPSTMSTTFAANRGSTMTVLFKGAYSLPAQNATTRPFNIVWKLSKPYQYLPKNGDLLLEWEVPITPTKSNYFLDCHKQTVATGAASVFGSGGSFSTPETYALSCPDVSQLKPGGSTQVHAGVFKVQRAAVLCYGFSKSKYGPLTLPLDLTALGAKGNYLNVSLDLLIPLPLTAGSGGFEGTQKLPIPNDKGLLGLALFAQGIFTDQKANTLGLVFSKGLQLDFARNVLFASLVGHYDYKQSSGWLQKGTGYVMQFDGIFQ